MTQLAREGSRRYDASLAGDRTAATRMLLKRQRCERESGPLLPVAEAVEVVLSILTLSLGQLLDHQRIGRFARLGGHFFLDRLADVAANVRRRRLRR